MQNAAEQLLRFRNAYKDKPPESLQDDRVVLPNLLTPPESYREAVPAPPFLVAAVIEALLKSRFSGIVTVVPGEAEIYCALNAKASKALIFSDDSDLFLHEIGPDSSVVLLRQIDVFTHEDSTWLQLVLFQPSVIKSHLRIADLKKPAFFLNHPRQRSFTQAIELSKKHKSGQNSTLTTFLHMYTEQDRDVPLHAITSGRRSTTNDVFFRRLDPRISELILQAMPWNLQPLPTSVRRDGAKRKVVIYLQSLSEDALEMSAWRAGLTVRQVAYSILGLVDSSFAAVTEVSRLKSRVGENDVQLIDRKLLEPTILDLVESIRSLISRSKGLPMPVRWRMIAAGDVFRVYLEDGQPYPSLLEAFLMVTLRTPRTWSCLHASAQLQCALYSYRILNQVLKATGTVAVNTSPEIAHAVERLREQMVDIRGLVSTLEDFKLDDLSAEHHLMINEWAKELVEKAQKSRSEQERIAKEKEVHYTQTVVEESDVEQEEDDEVEDEVEEDEVDHAQWAPGNPFAALSHRPK